jgi:hypothetical protein
MNGAARMDEQGAVVILTLSQFGWHEWLIQRALFPRVPPSMIVPSLS